MAALGVACAMALVTTACGSDDEADGSDNAPPPASEGGTVDVGVIASLSGANAPNYAAFRQGIDAGLEAYSNGDGKCSSYDFNVVEADDQSSPQGTLAAVQKLVEEENVYAILSASPTFAGAVSYATTQADTVPILGYNLDNSPQWADLNSNLFSAAAVPAPDAVYATTGEYFAQIGVTKLASVSFSVDIAQQAMRATAASAEAAGVEDVLQYGSLQFGSADVGGLVRQIIDSDADGLWGALTPDVALQLLTQLRQNGWEGQVVLPTGSADVLKSPELTEQSQGVHFSLATAPVELDNEATQTFSQALADAGFTGASPGFYESAGYLSASLFTYGLELADCDAPGEEYISTLRGDDGFDAGGLLPGPRDFSVAEDETSCQYFVTVEDDALVPDNDGEPICGDRVN